MYMYSMSPARVESGPSWYTVVSYYWLLTTAMYNMSYYNIPLLLSNYMYQHTWRWLVSPATRRGIWRLLVEA